jgi:glyoxylase-like metal-dependent hydrolase (beta-lactamase superfamily II)
MSLRLFAFTCGRLRCDLGRLMEGGEGEVELPVPAYLIEQPKGTALFDTGMHPDCQRPGRAAGGPPGQAVRVRLPAAGRGDRRAPQGDRPRPGEHRPRRHPAFSLRPLGGNAQIPNAVIVVQEREWQAGMDPALAVVHGFDRRDFDLGHPVRKISGEHDLFGDRSVVCLPTHGHTPGHQSLKLRLDRGEVVLAADACYFCCTLRERRLPRFAHDREAMRASLDRLDRLEAGGARIFFGHDPEFWKSVPQAPAPIG